MDSFLSFFNPSSYPSFKVIYTCMPRHKQKWIIKEKKRALLLLFCLFVGLLLTIVQLFVPQPCGVAARVFYQGGNWEVERLVQGPRVSGTRSCDLGAGCESNSIIHQFYNLEKANGLSSLANLYSGEGAYEERLNAISGLSTPPAMWEMLLSNCWSHQSPSATRSCSIPLSLWTSGLSDSRWA